MGFQSRWLCAGKDAKGTPQDKLRLCIIHVLASGSNLAASDMEQFETSLRGMLLIFSSVLLCSQHD